MFFENGHLVVDGPSIATIVQIGPLAIRWYALAYIGGVVGGWYLLAQMLRRRNAPLTYHQSADLIFWVMIGVVLGGRVGYILFYGLDSYLANPVTLLQVWDGGMAYHGGALGTLIAVLAYAARHQLNGWRIFDYVVCVQPIGQLLGRIANFINGELWGAPTSAPWGVIFLSTDPTGQPRHPSQLYEALLEGALLLVVLQWLFWRTDMYQRPWALTGAYMATFGIARFLVEFVREPDAQLVGLTGPLHMGQWLSLPMIPVGLYLVSRGWRRSKTA